MYTGDEQQQDSKNSKGGPESSVALSGERTHGLPVASPNDTWTAETSDTDKILDRIRIHNEDQAIRNEDVFGPVGNGTVAVIVIQVHNRLHYLRQLIISLSQARDIEKTLIIFSHDFWDPDINELVASVDFAKTLQIFYPFSIQTHQNTFPGESKNDCPRNAKKKE